MTTPADVRRIAVIGSGVSGLTAAHVLRCAGSVTLFESDDRLGGHAHTHEVAVPGGTVGVDSGFLVHNTVTYPTLTRLFAELGVSTRESEMSLSVSCRGCGLCYAGGRGPGGLFPVPGNVLRPRFLRLLTEVPRYYRHARALLASPERAGAEVTLGQFLNQHGFNRYVTHHFVLPLVSAVWSCPPGQALRYPARYLMRFLDNHGLLSVSTRLRWRTVVGGSRTYVDRIAGKLDQVRTGTPVRQVIRHHDGVEVRTEADERLDFDAVVLATHPDQALALLADPSRQERAVLGAIRYSVNPAVLHRDGALLPGPARARASWNYTMPSCTGDGQVRIDYDVNRLQRLGVAGELVVSLGAVRPRDVLATMTYRHPVYTPESLAAQQRLPRLASPRLVFAGAYHGWGFHEDGCVSGVRAARQLGVSW